MRKWLWPLAFEFGRIDAGTLRELGLVYLFYSDYRLARYEVGSFLDGWEVRVLDFTELHNAKRLQ